MVGDSPEIDIAGGKRSNMHTVLVESGLYNPHDTIANKIHHSQYLQYADTSVPDIEKAVDYILNRH